MSRGAPLRYGCPRRHRRTTIVSHAIQAERLHTARGVREFLLTRCGRPVDPKTWLFVSRGAFDSLPCADCKRHLQSDVAALAARLRNAQDRS